MKLHETQAPRPISQQTNSMSSERPASELESNRMRKWKCSGDSSEPPAKLIEINRPRHCESSPHKALETEQKRTRMANSNKLTRTKTMATFDCCSLPLLVDNCQRPCDCSCSSLSSPQLSCGQMNHDERSALQRRPYDGGAKSISRSSCLNNNKNKQNKENERNKSAPTRRPRARNGLTLSLAVWALAIVCTCYACLAQISDGAAAQDQLEAQALNSSLNSKQVPHRGLFHAPPEVESRLHLGQNVQGKSELRMSELKTG